MKVNLDCGLRMVARSFMKEICIRVSGRSMPECQANSA